MRKKELERKILNSLSNSVPDVLDNILKTCEKKKGFEKMEIKKENKSNNNIIVEKTKTKHNYFSTKKLAGVFASFVIIFMTIIGINGYNNSKIDSIIEFDVNPSIELKVDKDEEVIKAIALNEDGKKVLEGMDFEDVDLNIAVNAIVGSMIKNGYLTIEENSILVSVKNANKEKGAKLQEEISKEIDEILKASNINGAILTQDYSTDKTIETLAKKYNISEGKAKLISRIINSNLINSNGEKYKEETLSKLSINELNLLLSSKNTTIDNVTSNGNMASEKTYIGKEKAKEIAFNHANVTENNLLDLEVELDADNGILIYEVEFKLDNKEYEYDINSKTGDIIDYEINIDDDYYDYDDDYDDDDDDDD